MRPMWSETSSEIVHSIYLRNAARHVTAQKSAPWFQSTSGAIWPVCSIYVIIKRLSAHRRTSVLILVADFLGFFKIKQTTFLAVKGIFAVQQDMPHMNVPHMNLPHMFRIGMQTSDVIGELKWAGFSCAWYLQQDLKTPEQDNNVASRFFIV